jgi:hypothetical protein
MRDCRRGGFLTRPCTLDDETCIKGGLKTRPYEMEVMKWKKNC